MKYRGIFEYEYPTEHKPPVSIDVHLHGDCVKGKIIEWEYRPQEQESIIDKIRAEIAEYGSIWVQYKITGKSDRDIEQLVSGVLKQAKEQVLDVIDKYKAEIEPQESEDKHK